MATATAPTPVDLGEAIQVSLNHWVHEYKDKLRDVIEEMAEPMTWPSSPHWAVGDEPGPTPSESPWGVLDGQLGAAMRIRADAAIDSALDAALDSILDQLTLSALDFAIKHPDAPRSEEPGDVE